MRAGSACIITRFILLAMLASPSGRAIASIEASPFVPNNDGGAASSYEVEPGKLREVT
jgi:hypothetical protein